MRRDGNVEKLLPHPTHTHIQEKRSRSQAHTPSSPLRLLPRTRHLAMDRPAVTQALLALRVIVSFWLISWGAIFVLECWSFSEAFFSQDLRRNKDLLYLRLALFGNTFFNLLTFALVATTAFVVPFPSQSCDPLVKVMPMMYAMAIQMVFLFFLLKAHIVGRFERSRVYIVSTKLLWYGTMVGIPLVLLPVCGFVRCSWKG
jgi:hypothetical protein